MKLVHLCMSHGRMLEAAGYRSGPSVDRGSGAGDSLALHRRALNECPELVQRLNPTAYLLALLRSRGLLEEVDFERFLRNINEVPFLRSPKSPGQALAIDRTGPRTSRAAASWRSCAGGVGPSSLTSSPASGKMPRRTWPA